jgi:predicted nuclease with TOPRIM domain
MLTNYEKALYENLTKTQEMLHDSMINAGLLKQELQKFKEAEDRWYKHYCEKSNELEALKKELEALKQEKEEQDAGTSDSSDNLKEAV